MLKFSEKTMFLPCQFTVNQPLKVLNFKFSLICTIIFCSITTCSNMSKFHQDICKIKDIFINNGYREKFIDKCVKTFINKVFIPKRIVRTDEKKQVTIVLLYI